MKLPSLNKLDPVIILWQDTHTPASPGWMTEQEHTEWTKAAGSKVISIGFYISHDKDFIHLVGDADADECEQVNYLRPMSIGRGFIKSIKVLKQ